MNTILVWHRRDLRTEDNTALTHAVKDAGGEIIPVFIFDDAILGRDDVAAVRVAFMLESLADLAAQYDSLGSNLIFRRGNAEEELKTLAKESAARAIYFNEDYEPYAKARDAKIKSVFERQGLDVKSFQDHVFFKGEQILTAQGKPYTVFSPYRRNWLSQSEKIPAPAAAPKHLKMPQLSSLPLPEITRLDFAPQPKVHLGGSAEGHKLLSQLCSEKIVHYADQRNYPNADGTSRLSPHFKFGTLSVRRIYRDVQAQREFAASEPERHGVDVFTSELIWRDFYYQIIDHFPHVAERSFKDGYEKLKWENHDEHFEAWKAGRTGFPIVDAAMRQMNETGWMHNRLRMIVASFLTKDLLIDWRRGEKYFMQRLVDGDLAANNGGWQWSASTGTDAQPYFRIFNPASQSEKFDESGQFIKRFVPELGDVPAKFIHAPHEAALKTPLLTAEFGKNFEAYPKPIVDHKIQREKALAMFKALK
ncbi:MAG: deoxyribodipyrimidine photo-lyase [Rhizobacter sp.]|nr:deoxyribodipyrimidine photo-lyase [Chlorobiales bacterium]